VADSLAEVFAVPAPLPESVRETLRQATDREAWCARLRAHIVRAILGAWARRPTSDPSPPARRIRSPYAGCTAAGRAAKQARQAAILAGDDAMTSVPERMANAAPCSVLVIRAKA
jgi:hypothetical protein